jgi:hypothetical protein
MGRFTFEWGNNIQQPLSVEHNVNGDWWYEMFSSKNTSKDLNTYRAKLNTVLRNPACLKVFKLNCDLFSLGKVNQYQNDELKEINYLYSIKKKPNHFQTWTQFFWDYMFWKMLGTAVLYRSNNVLNESTQLYWLNPANVDFQDGNNRFSKFIFSIVGLNEQQRETIKYTFDDGKISNIKLKELSFFFDLSNGLGGNWYQGNSALDALYKVISNSEQSLDAKGINLEFSQKFMVNGKNSLEDVSQTPMGETEKRDIEQSVRSNKKVHAVKTPIDVKRFVDDIARLKLDESFYNDYFMIGTMYGIPRDVLEANLRGSTYENQEKATARHVEYSLKPSGQALTDEFEYLFQLEDLRFEWSHLMFNQVFEKEKQEVIALKLDNEIKARELKIKIETL